MQYLYKIKYALPQNPRTCSNVYIGIGSTCKYKGEFDKLAFIKARVAQSVEH